MIQHFYFGYGFATCGTLLDADNTINKLDDGITFNCLPEQRCQKCIEYFAPTARLILDTMLRKIELPTARLMLDAIVLKDVVRVLEKIKLYEKPTQGRQS